MSEERYTALQNNFVLAFTAFGMDTFQNSLLSIIAAGSKAKTDNALSAVASRMLSTVKIKAKIDAIEAARTAVLVQKTGYSIEQAQQEYEQARLHASELRQPAAEVSAITGKARLYGFDKDNNLKDGTIIVINPPVQRTKVESEVIDADGTG